MMGMTKKEILHNIAVIDDIVMGHLENYTTKSESELMWYKEKLMKDLKEIEKKEEKECIMKKLALVLLIPLLLFSCKTIEKAKDYNLSLSDSLWIQERTIDSIVRIPYSYLPLVVLPNDMRDGEKVEKKEGQANVSIEKKGDTLIVIASCDSLKLIVKGMERQLTMVKKENETLKEEVKKKPSFNRFHWFLAGFLTMLVLAIIIYIKRRK